MSTGTIKEWAKAYMRAQLAHGLNTDHADWWAVEKFMKIGMKEEATASESWEAILMILELDPPDKVIAILAAGPLEDLIDDCGEEYVDRIEHEAKFNLKFRHLLGGVWKSSTPDVWARIEKIRGETW